MRFVCYDALKMSIDFAGAHAESTPPINALWKSACETNEEWCLGFEHASH